MVEKWNIIVAQRLWVGNILIQASSYWNKRKFWTLCFFFREIKILTKKIDAEAKEALLKKRKLNIIDED